MPQVQDSQWHEYLLPAGNWVLAKRCWSRAPLVNSVVIYINRSACEVALYLQQAESVAKVLRHSPTRIYADDEISQLHEFLHWEDLERTVGEAHCQPFSELHPAARYIDGILEKWRLVHHPGWMYCTLGHHGISFLKDIDSVDNDTHAIEVTDKGISIYRTGIEFGGLLCTDDRIIYLSTGLVTIEAVARVACWAHASEACNLARSLRRWILNLAMTST
jgi:hypothetical protein